ncbi:MAG: hypothetical protein J3R72DRAFT_450096 [Linnemannia gamsii]|nr:MAG: hypothetical protein J3R72DRAFT_450096 [Linnemannia gamsii]
MSPSRKIIFLVAFVATVAFIGLTDPAMGAPASAAAGSIDSGSAARLFKRMAEGETCASEQLNACQAHCDEVKDLGGHCDSGICECFDDLLMGDLR